MGEQRGWFPFDQVVAQVGVRFWGERTPQMPPGCYLEAWLGAGMGKSRA